MAVKLPKLEKYYKRPLGGISELHWDQPAWDTHNYIILTYKTPTRHLEYLYLSRIWGNCNFYPCVFRRYDPEAFRLLGPEY